MKASPIQVIQRLFLAHPTRIGETYSEHGFHALYIATRLTVAGLACFIHAFVPGLFARTASNAVEDVERLMAQRENAARNPSPRLQTGTDPST